VKTPTAAAEYLLSALSQQAYRLDANSDRLTFAIQRQMESYKQQLQVNSDRLKTYARDRIHAAQLLIERRESELLSRSSRFLLQKNQMIEMQLSNLMHRTRNNIELQKHRAELLEKSIATYSPELMIQKGFSLTLHQGKVVKSIKDLPIGAVITTRLRNGLIFSTIDKTEIQND